LFCCSMPFYNFIEKILFLAVQDFFPGTDFPILQPLNSPVFYAEKCLGEFVHHLKNFKTVKNKTFCLFAFLTNLFNISIETRLFGGSRPNATLNNSSSLFIVVSAVRRARDSQIEV